MNNLDLEALCHTCFSTLDDHLNHKNPKRSSLVDQISCPVFVTWKRWNQEQEWELRGCIGTFNHVPLNSIGDWALKSALQDRRFSPISLNELPLLKVGISLLTDFEEIQDKYDWEIGKHGLWIEHQGRSATFLPEVALEQGWDHDTTWTQLMYKGQLSKVSIQKRYQSLKREMEFKDYSSSLLS